MSRVRLLLAVVLALSALVVLAAPASASVPATNTKFCKIAAKIGNANSGTQLSKGKAKAIRDQFKATAKYAPKKVKSAISNITKFLGTVVGTTDPSDLAKVYASKAFKTYPQSITTFLTYQASECAGS